MAGGMGMKVNNNKDTGVMDKDSTIEVKMDPEKNEFGDRTIQNSKRNDKEWKERMFRIHNREFTLRYANTSLEAVDAKNGYEIIENGSLVKELELEEGISVTLKEPVSILETYAGAEEAVEENDLSKSVYLMSPAGEMTFDLSKIKGMEDMKSAEKPVANLGMFQMVMNFGADGKEAYGVEISAYLKDSLRLETNDKTKLELVQGEYQKTMMGEGMLKFADSYASTRNGKVNVPRMTELHFQENTERENDTQNVVKKESYYYKAFASTEVKLQKIKEEGEKFEADSAKMKIFGFPLELKDVSVNDSKGIMNAGKANLKWGKAALELEEIQIKEKRKKVKGLKIYNKDKKGNERFEGSVVNKLEELKEVEAEGRIKTEAWEMEAQDGIDSVQAKVVSLKVGDGITSLRGTDQINVEIKESIFAPEGEMELHRHKLSMLKVEITKDLEVSALTAREDIDNFGIIMDGFHYKEGKEATYDKARVMSILKLGKKEDSKDKKSKDSKIKEEQQIWWFHLGKGNYAGEFEDGTKSTGYLATGNIEKIKVTEGTIKEDSLKTEEKQGKISNKKRTVMNRLKKMRREKEKSKKKKAPKIKTKERPEEILKDDMYTLDGFAKIENATFEFGEEAGEKKVSGEGCVKFQDIPLIYYINDKIKNSKIAFAPEEAVDSVTFTFDRNGNLNAAFEEDAEAEFNLKGIKGKENSGEGTIFTITLGDLSIENGYLKAGSASLQRGLKLEQEGFEEEDDPLEMTEKAKNFLGCELTGSIVNESEEHGVELTAEGIRAHLGKNKLGKFGVSGFMGFLGGEVDFRGGEIAVSAEKSYEPEKLQESFFKLDKKTPEIEANIPTPIPGVAVEFSVTPSVGIGGAVGLGVKLGTPFLEWKKDSLELDGAIEGEGHAGITVGAGVDIGASYLASVDLKLEGGLNASLEGSLEGSTTFSLNKDEKSGKKMQQSEDFTFNGSLGGKLEAEASVTSSAKFLFWKKQLFKFELFKKELGKLSIKGQGKKSKDERGFFHGWELTSGEFEASWFKKEVLKQYSKAKKVRNDVISREEFDNLVMNCSEAAKDAWAVLCKLQEKREDTAIILSKSDKEALDGQIELAKKEVVSKIDEYLIVLNSKKATLETDLNNAKNDLAKKKKEEEEYKKAQGLSEDVFEKAAWGGFDKNKYLHKELPDKIKEEKFPGLNSADKKVKKQAQKSYNEAVEKRNADMEEKQKYNAKQDANAAIDLMITYMLGQVSQENINRIKQEYLKKFHIELDEDAKKAYDPTSYKESFYRSHTEFIDTIPEYFHQSNYYQMLNQRAVYEKDDAISVKAVSQYELDQLDGISSYTFERTINYFPKKIQEFIKKNPKITMKEILEKVLEGSLSAAEKLDFIKTCFVGILPKAGNKKLGKNHHMVIEGIKIKQGLFQAIGGLFSTIFKNTGESDEAKLEEVVKGKNVFDIFEKQKELKMKVADATNAVTVAQNNLQEIEGNILLVQNEIKKCGEKLNLAKTKASEAVVDKNFNSDAAGKAITLYSENYVEKMKDGGIVQNLQKKIKENKGMQSIQGMKALPKSVSRPL